MISESHCILILGQSVALSSSWAWNTVITRLPEDKPVWGPRDLESMRTSLPGKMESEKRGASVSCLPLVSGVPLLKDIALYMTVESAAHSELEKGENALEERR